MVAVRRRVVRPDHLRHEILEILIRSGADVNAKTITGETALLEATANNDLKAVEFLIENQAKIHEETTEGVTALHWAAEVGSSALVRCLLNAGANATMKTLAGELPIHWAGRNPDRKVASLFEPTGEESLNAGEQQHLSGETWGVLIGIDSVLPGSLSVVDDGRRKPVDNGVFQLRGCANDANLVERHLRDDMGVHPRNIKKLTTSQSEEIKRPTYGNILEAIESTTARAAPGDSVFVYYGGSSSTFRTAYPFWKGKLGMDLCLLPEDCTDRNKVLRDIELGGLVKEMLQKGLAVTLVLDCCTNGGLQIMPGIPLWKRNDTCVELEVSDSTLATVERTKSTFCRGSPHDEDRNLRPQSESYALFGAKKAMEICNEVTNHEFHGLLTFSFISLLRKNSLAGLSYQAVLRRLIAERKQHGAEEYDAPFLVAEAGRSFYGFSRQVSEVSER